MRPTCTRSFVFAAVCMVYGLAVVQAVAAADWPQWRGPARNGILSQSPPLADQWPKKGLTKLWESEAIPCDDDGGHGSVVVVGGRVYAALVWHTDVATETRAIDDLVLRAIGYQPVNFPQAVVDDMERIRMTLDPKLTGSEFDKFLADWLEKNLDPKRRQTCAGYVRHRFERRATAIPLEVYERLLTVSKQRFPSQAALVEWLNAQNFGAAVTKEILDAVPPTMKVAEDVVLCLDLATGRTLWKFKAPGVPIGRMASSTPCVADGCVYALGSQHFYAVDANSGKQIWAVPSPVKTAVASSPLAVDGVLVVNAGRLCAFDAGTGKPLWTQPKAGGGSSSPVVWKAGGKTVVICNGRGVMAGVDLQSGKLLWTTPAGGDCTPAIVGDALAVQTNNAQVGILAGRLTATGFTPSWNIPYDPLRSQSSPIIFDGHVYLMDDGVHWCLDLATGRELWKEKVASSSITSPVLADGKIFLLINGGGRVAMFKPSPEKYLQLGKANARALGVPSPAIADGKLVLRGRKGILCYNLAADAAVASRP
jgi:outer membrane protein assembly factor BamB